MYDPPQNNDIPHKNGLTRQLTTYDCIWYRLKFSTTIIFYFI